MQGAQCDNCRVFAPNLAAGWFVLQSCKAGDGAHAYIGQTYMDIIGTFCSIKCLSDFAYVAVAVGGQIK